MKIVKKALIYLGMVSGLVVMLNFVVPNPYTTQRNDIEEIISHSSQYQSFTFGRSHAASINYEYYNKTGHNFALGGRDLASIEYLLHYLIPRCDSLKEVLLFFSYTSLYFDNTAMSAGNLNDARKALYYTVPVWYPIEMSDFNNFLFGKALTFIQPDHGQGLLKEFCAERKNNHEDEAEVKVLSEEEMRQSGIDQARRDVLDRQSALLYDKEIVENNVGKLKSIIAYCLKNNIKVYLIQSPYFNTYNEQVPQSIVKEVNEIVKKISLEYGISHVDFSKDSAFVNDRDLFMNSDHLNAEGKRKFTKILNNIIK